MVTVSSLRYSLVADTTRFKAGLDSAQALLAKAEADVNKRSTARDTSSQQAVEKNAKRTRDMIAQERSMLMAATKAWGMYQAARLAGSAMRTTVGLAARGFRLAGEAEMARADFGALTGSQARGGLLADQLMDYAQSTTLSSPTVMSGAQRLLAFGTEADRVIPTLKMLGDIAGGSDERMMGLALAFGQATSLGRLQREEVNQMVERGFNPMVYITKITGESMEELSDRMQKGGVAASELVAAMELATSQGEKFFDRVNAKAETFLGQLDLLKDDFDVLLRDLAALGIEPGKQSVGAVRGLLGSMRENPGVLADAGGSFIAGTIFGPTAQTNWNMISGLFGGGGLASSAIRDKVLSDRLATVVAANIEAAAEELPDETTGNAFGGIASFAGRLANTVAYAGGLLADTAKFAAPGVAGIASDVMARATLSDMKRQYDEIEDKPFQASSTLSTTTAGSREEFQLRAQMQTEKENKENKERERQQHDEAQAKRDELINAMNQIRDKLDLPMLVGIG